ncbi:MAG: MBL fold metallo-hydrolase [Lachnospiraceae bacterium]|nr:MBL fold metallo-hydrolase [Lachnospiraceae bacterium]
MKLTVLVDNNTYIDQYYLGEPAVSYFLELDGHRILFDTGYSNAFLKNAKKMQIDLRSVTEIVLSHGHNDHSRGLKFMANQYDLSSTRLIAHPHALKKKRVNNESIGAPYTEIQIAKLLHYTPVREPCFISEHCVFLGEIPQTTAFEKRQKIGTTLIESHDVDDCLFDDTALACMTPKGLVIVTGCSHSGICNIIEYAKKIWNTETIAAVIGGFHLFELDDRTSKTIAYLKTANIGTLYPCHCVSFPVKAEMSRHMNVKEVGVGLHFEYEGK